jgi:hypothetical protein
MRITKIIIPVINGKKKKKYRVVEKTYDNSAVEYIVQRRNLFHWTQLGDQKNFEHEPSAIRYLKNYLTKPKNKKQVIYKEL